MKKWIYLVILLPCIAFATGNTLRVGTLDLYPPYVTRIQTSGGFSGFDMDIMDAVCQRIERHCVYHGFQFDELFQLIDAKTIDVAIGAILITKERRSIVAFSEPYAESYLVFLVSQSKVPIARGKQQLVGMLNQMIPHDTLIRLGLDPQNVKSYENLSNLIDDLVHGKLSKGIMDQYAAQYWINSSNYDVVQSGPKMAVGEGYGIVLSQDEVILKEEINKALDDIENDGTYIKIYNKYFSTE